MVSLEASFRTPGLNCSVFEYLPRSLRKLKVDGPSHVYATELASLPSNLETLNFRFPLADPFEPWTLPRSLTSLQVGTPILGTDLAHLPPKLVKLSAPCYSVTLAQARQVPPGLHTLKLLLCEERQAAEEGGFLHSLAWRILCSLCRPFWRIREYSEAYLLSEIDIATLEADSCQSVLLKMDLKHETEEADEEVDDDGKEAEEGDEEDAGDDGDEGDDDMPPKQPSRPLSSILPVIPPNTPQFDSAQYYDPLDLDDEDGDDDSEGGSNVDSNEADEDEGNESEANDDDGEADEEEGDEGEEKRSMDDEDEEDGDADDDGAPTAASKFSLLSPVSDPSEDMDPRTIRRFSTITQ